jgi:ATP-binding cassette subfamily B protein
MILFANNFRLTSVSSLFNRLSTLLTMDRILVFERGEITQDGTHDELVEQEGLYKRLWQAQVGWLLPDNKGTLQ